MLILKVLAPYFAVGVFWALFQNAWLSIIAYHAQIVLWNFKRIKTEKFLLNKLSVGLVILSAFAGVFIYFMLPHITNKSLNDWFLEYKISNRSIYFLIPYFGIVHPFLEQKHWKGIRDTTLFSHIAFAGYHAVVLVTLLKVEWVLVSLGVLLSISFFWKFVNDKNGSDSATILSHIFADFGIILAAFLRT
jgi:tetrahydromethanopterin S-methyltransferase subunit C